MDTEQAFGRILLNLKALEFALRVFLLDPVEAHSATCSLDIEKLDFGDWVPEDALTNYDSLGALVCKVNERLKVEGVPDRIDESLVDLRDALAHGRLYSDRPKGGPFQLLKFSRAEKGQVQVTTAILVTPQWLTEQVKRTKSEVEKVVQVARRLGNPCFPPNDLP